MPKVYKRKKGWYVLEKDSTELPKEYFTHDMPVSSEDWRGRLSMLNVLLQKCKPPTSWDAVVDGLQEDQQCYCPSSCARWMGKTKFRIVLASGYARSSKDLNRGYIRVEPEFWRHQTSPLYLHTFICIAYRGEAKGKVAAHSCNNRLCINPWHIRWATHSRDRRDFWNEKKQRSAIRKQARERAEATKAGIRAGLAQANPKGKGMARQELRQLLGVVQPKNKDKGKAKARDQDRRPLIPP